MKFQLATRLAQIAEVLQSQSRGELDDTLRDLREEERAASEGIENDHSTAAMSGEGIGVLRPRGEPDESLRTHRDKVVRSCADTLGIVASVLRSRDELVEALRILREEVLPIYERLGDDLLQAMTISIVADILESCGEQNEALRILREKAVPLYDRLKDVPSLAATVIRVAKMLTGMGVSVDPPELALLERMIVEESLPADAREEATSLRRRIEADRVTRWREWLYGAGPEEEFHTLPRGATGSPFLEVQAVRLRNIRAFEDTEWVTFADHSDSRPRACVLILGDNAAGKTTILRCIALAAVGPDQANKAERRAWSYLRRDRDVGYIEVQFHLRLDNGEFLVGTTICVGLKIVAGERDFRPMDDDDMTFGEKRNAADRVDWLRRQSGQRFGFLCAYGALRGIIEVPPEFVPEEPNESLNPILPLFRPGVPLLDPDLLGRLLAGHLSSLRSAPSERLHPEVQKALRRHLDSLLPWSEGIVEQSPSMIRVHGQNIHLRDLSEGYGSLLAMVGHLFSQALPALNWQDDPATLPGVVLIDEIDVHLHPTWQRRIMTDLKGVKGVFSHLQIICTSHSAVVAGSAPSNSLFVLLQRDENSLRVRRDLPSVKGWRVDQILTSVLFDLSSTRDQETEQLTDRYARLINERGPEDEEVRELEAELERRQPENPGSTPLDRQALSLLEEAIREELAQEAPERRDALLTALQRMLFP